MNKLVVIILVLFMAGCTEKDELTSPVRVHFKIALTGLGSIQGWYAEYFEFTEGRILIQKIRFEGKREYGEDIFFETDPDIDLPIIEFGTQPYGSPPALITGFDIPQGIYNSWKWDIYMKRIMTDELIADEAMDLHDIGLVIKGSFNQTWWSPEYYPFEDSTHSIQVLLAIDAAEQFSLMSKMSYNLEDSQEIVLSGWGDRQAIMYFDPYNAFETIKRESIEEAEVSSDINGQPIIIISSDKNKHLYENILYRLSQSARVLVHY
jgi:hypothetical protein